jgi:hypothetical protein
VILLVRDLHDTVVSSCLNWPCGSLASMLRYYNVWAAQRTVPREFKLVRYEDMHADAPGELRRVHAFLGLDPLFGYRRGSRPQCAG